MQRSQSTETKAFPPAVVVAGLVPGPILRQQLRHRVRPEQARQLVIALLEHVHGGHVPAFAPHPLGRRHHLDRVLHGGKRDPAQDMEVGVATGFGGGGRSVTAALRKFACVVEVGLNKQGQRVTGHQFACYASSHTQ
jgi:hypothetical protein